MKNIRGNSNLWCIKITEIHIGHANEGSAKAFTENKKFYAMIWEELEKCNKYCVYLSIAVKEVRITVNKETW